MNTKVLIIINSFLAFVLTIVFFPSGGIAAICSTALVLIAVRFFRAAEDADDDEKDFLVQIFLLALIPRIILAALIYGFGLELVFGPDATTYHSNGTAIAAQWWSELMRSTAELPTGSVPAPILAGDSANWGMTFFVSALYFLFGSNALLLQLCSVICGAATAPVLYLCARTIFQNRKVARFSAFFVALFPAMIIWSSQGLKDGFIVFFLVLGILAILRLQKTFNYFNITILLLVMIGLFTFRFYLFPLLSLAAISGFLISSQTSLKDIFSRTAILILIGIFLTFLGITQQSQVQIEEASNLKRIDSVRRGGNDTADSGFNDNADISTTSGALAALPMGILNLLMAPFPWQMQKVTQIMLLPEMVIWWISLPLTFLGLWYVLKNKLRENISILVFIAMLGLSYALFQGNIGTMYRQRTQIQVFLLMFTAVGVVMTLEKREAAKMLRERGQQMNRGRINPIQS